MATFTMIDTRELEAALAEAGIATSDPVSVAGVPAGSVNSNYRVEVRDPSAPSGVRRYFLRLYEEQDRRGAEREARLLRYLASRGIPTPPPISWSSGNGRAPGDADTDPRAITILSGKPAAIFAWVEGDTRCQRSVTTASAAGVGQALARVHRAGESLGIGDYGEGRFRPADLRQRLPRIAAAEDVHLSAQALPLARRLAACEARRDPALPRGLVHGDLFRDNVLWSEEGHIAALLDFESASEGVFAFDLAVTVLAWTFGDAFDGALARAMIAGYESVRPLTLAERRGFLAEATLAALRFTITRITDYAMPRAGADGSRVHKDWRRFDARARWLETVAEGGAGLAWMG